MTLKVVPGLPGLRSRDVWKAVAWAMAITVRRHDFRICHVSIQGNHIHLVVEADSRTALARGMQGFQISCAKGINARITVRGAPRRGKVFADRYHARPLERPTTVRNAVSYVLNNWRHHRLDRGARHLTDPYSSGYTFSGWSERADEAWFALPRTWLLRIGWKRGGGLLSVHDVPGELPV